MTVIVAAMGWSWREAEVDPLTGAVSADPTTAGRTGRTLPPWNMRCAWLRDGMPRW